MDILREAKGVLNDLKSPDIESKCSTPKETKTVHSQQIFLRMACYNEKNRDCRQPTVALRRSKEAEYSCGPNKSGLSHYLRVEPFFENTKILIKHEQQEYTVENMNTGNAEK